MAVSWTCTSNPARGRGWLLCTLPTLPQSQNLCVWALFMLFPMLPFRALVQTGGVCLCVCGIRPGVLHIGITAYHRHYSARVTG